MADLLRDLRQHQANLNESTRLLTECLDLRNVLEMGVLTEDEARVAVLRLRGAIQAFKRARLTGPGAGGNMDEPY